MKPPKYDFSKAKKKTNGAPAYDFNKPSKGIEIDVQKNPDAVQKLVEQAGGVLKGAYNLTQIPVKMATTAIDPERDVSDFLSDVGQRGSQAVEEAPTGREAMESVGVPPTKLIPKEFRVSEDYNPTLSGTLGAGVELATDPLTYMSPKMLGGALGKGLDVAEVSIKNFGGKQSTKVLNKWLTKTKALKEGIDPEVVGKQIFEEDIAGLLNDPVKLKEVLGGTREVAELVSPLGVAFQSTKGTKPGMIKNIADDVTGMVEEAARQNPDKGILLRDTLSKMTKFNILDQKSAELGGEFFNEALKKKVRTLLDDLIVKGESNRMKAMTAPDLLKFKRNIGKQLQSREFFKMDQDTQALAKEVLTETYRKIDEFLVNALDDMPVQYGDEFIENTGQVYKIQNRRVKNLVNMREILEGVDLKEIDKADAAQLIMGAIPWVGAGGLIGTVGGYGTGKGMMIGGAFPFARAASKKMMEKSPEILTKGAKGAQRAVQGMQGMKGPALMAAPSVLRPDPERGQTIGREPQSVGMPVQAKVNFMLADTQIPRSTEWIKEHPNLVVGRLMQVAPELAAQVQIALEKGQDQILKKTLPLMAQQVPEIFEYDEYGSFDGKIIDPNMKQMYTEKVMSDPDLDTYEKAEIIDHLNKTNEVLQ